MGFDLTGAALRIEEFAVERDWQQFHTLKNLTLALTGEIGELAEILQWRSDEQIRELLTTVEGRAHFEEEVADIVIYTLRIAQRAGIDLSSAIDRKILTNESKYPVANSKGSATKSTEFEH